MTSRRRSTSANAPAKGTRPAPVARSNARETIESAGARFDEATDHVRRREPFLTIDLGPTVPLPYASLRPGTMGWSRSVTGRAKAARPTASSATLYYTLLPEIEEPADSSDVVGPFTDLPWTAFSYAEPVRGSPRALLLLRAEGAGAAKRLRPFTEAVRSELESESD